MKKLFLALLILCFGCETTVAINKEKFCENYPEHPSCRDVIHSSVKSDTVYAAIGYVKSINLHGHQYAVDGFDVQMNVSEPGSSQVENKYLIVEAHPEFSDVNNINAYIASPNNKIANAFYYGYKVRIQYKGNIITDAQYL